MIPQPRIEPHPEKIGKYIVLEDFHFEWEAELQRQKLLIEKGFVFDLASVPRIFWTPTGITPNRLRWTAPLIHDFLYHHKGILPYGSYSIWDNDLNGWVISDKIWTRKNADKLFCRTLREDGISRIKRRMAYRAVRAAGWYAWKT